MTQRRDQLNGFLLVNKPVGMTSHDVVAHVRRKFKTKVGHAGTLDPFAAGLLVVLLGEGTRLMQWVVGHDKRYTALVRLGGRSSTDDRTGDIEPTSAPMPRDHRVWSAVAQLEASTEQVPPGISALHVDGVRSYKRVRRGETVELKPRPVTFRSIRVTEYAPSRGTIGIDMTCSTGTYVRAFARDLGELLGTGGYLSELRRTEVGSWKLDSAVHLEQITEADVRPLAELVGDLPVLRLSSRLVRSIVDGRTLLVRDSDASRRLEFGDALAVHDMVGNLVAVCNVTEPDPQPKVAVVLGPEVDPADQGVVAVRPRTVLSSARVASDEESLREEVR